MNNIKNKKFILPIVLFLCALSFFVYLPSVNASCQSDCADGSDSDLLDCIDRCNKGIEDTDGAGSGWLTNKLFLGLAWIVYGIVWTVGLLFIYMVKLLDWALNFNEFINIPTVVMGWTIVRDLCNMFFILILLVIAFATILRRESYSAKRLLGKLLIMAVLINFSRMICGLIIDLAQIIMLTFASGVGRGSNNLVHLLGFDKFLSLTSQAQGNPDLKIVPLSMLGALLAGLAAALVAFVVVVVLFVVLLFRIVMLWVYIILSPIAFLAAAFPAGAKYSSQWWSEFMKQVIVGPALAFFYWLAMTTAQRSITEIQSKAPEMGKDYIGKLPSDFFYTTETFQAYAITLALLVGGLMITQQMGGIAGSIAGKGMGTIHKGRAFAWKGTKRAGIGAGKFAGGVGLATAKRVDARYLKGAGATAIESVKHKGGAGAGAGAGAVIGSAFMPGLGTVVGAGVGAIAGGVAGKKLKTRMKNRRDLKNARLKVGDDGILEDPKDGIRYKHNNLDNKFYKVNDKDKWVDSSDNEITNQSQLASRGEAASRRFRDIRGMGGGERTSWASYSTSNRGRAMAAKDATEDEKITKMQSSYAGQSKSMLRELLNIEKNSTKQMAIAMTLAIKDGFTDHKQVNNAKDALGGNHLLLKKFNDEMNKRNMVMNNTRKDGSLDKGKVDRLITTGKAKWQDQNWNNMNGRGLDYMSEQQGIKFHKTLESSIKTESDKERANSIMRNGLDKRNFDGNDLKIRKSYGALSGDFLTAFDLENETKYERHSDEGKAMKAALSKIPKAEVFSNVNESVMKNQVFKDAFADSVNVSMLEKINNSQDMGSDMIKQYMEMAKTNANLKEQMRKSNKLSAYV